MEARIILHLDYRSHAPDATVMLDNLKWFSVKQRYDLHTATMVYKIGNDLVRPYSMGELSTPNVHLKVKTFKTEVPTSEIISPLMWEMHPV